MGLFKTPEQRAINYFEKFYFPEMSRQVLIYTGQNCILSEEILRKMHKNSVTHALHHAYKRGYTGYNTDAISQVYWQRSLAYYSPQFGR